MDCYIRSALAFFIGILLSLSVNAQEIKYSMGPKCNGSEVICGSNEVPVCLFLESGMRLVPSNAENLDKKYIPFCIAEAIPTCAEENGHQAPDHVVIECVEFVQCLDKEAHCSGGKIAKCLGNNDELNGCNCSDGSDPICDYPTWQISNTGS